MEIVHIRGPPRLIVVERDMSDAPLPTGADPAAPQQANAAPQENVDKPTCCENCQANCQDDCTQPAVVEPVEQVPEEQIQPEQISNGNGRKYVIVRHGLMRQIGQFSHDLSRVPPPGAKVVIRTDRGVEIGEVLRGVANDGCQRCMTQEQLSAFVHANGPEYPFKRGGTVLRVANSQDIVDARHLENSARDEAKLCRQMIRSSRLQMRLVTVEHLLGGERIIFYFTAETRVDFRDLVRTLASEFRTRIEMRQVGARDEARIVADYERCGRQCCCQAYMKDLRPVSMRMAKTQKATLDPSKISGRCGRLMCCLRYEDACYEELRRQLPRKNTWVRIEGDKVGRVIDGQIITQLVRLIMPDNSQLVVPNEEILERDVAPPQLPPRAEPRPPRPIKQRPTKPLRDEAADYSAADEDVEAAPVLPDGPIEAVQPADEPAGAPQGPREGKRRRRRKKRHPQLGTQPPNQQAAAQSAPAGEGASAAAPAPQREGKRRRRRRNKNRNSGSPGQVSGTSSPPTGPAPAAGHQ